MMGNYTRLSVENISKNEVHFLGQDGYYLPMKLVLENNKYLIYYIDSNKLKSIDERSFSDQKRKAFILKKHNKIPLKKQEFCIYNSDEDFSKNAIGQPVFDKKSEKIIGFVNDVSGNMVFIDDMKEILEEIDRNFRRSYKHKLKEKVVDGHAVGDVRCNVIEFQKLKAYLKGAGIIENVAKSHGGIRNYWQLTKDGESRLNHRLLKQYVLSLK